jgi:energy-coupling factor transporter ATP-binding protein EcfA2
MPAVVMEAVTKTYRGRRGRPPQKALDDLDLLVESGGVHGFLGPNGSGKTTSIRVLLGLVSADSGSARIFDRPVPQALPEVIGHVGAFPWARSATDQRLVNDVINYTGFAPVTAAPAGEWNAIIAQPMTTRPAGYDTEVIPGNYFGTTTPRAPGDGMPTWWENLRGYNPNVDDKNILTDSNSTCTL